MPPNACASCTLFTAEGVILSRLVSARAASWRRANAMTRRRLARARNWIVTYSGPNGNARTSPQPGSTPQTSVPST